MKKILFVFICLCLVKTSQAQSWNLTLNTIAGSPNFGTLNNHPINFFTNGTQKMTLSTAGLLRINSLVGAGNRFLQTDATGNLVAWTGSMPNANYVLYGDGNWKLAPLLGDAGTYYMAANSKLGIGITTPTAALDVSGDVAATGSVKAPSGLKFNATDGITYNATDNIFVFGKLGAPTPALDPCLTLPSPSGTTWLSANNGGFMTSQVPGGPSLVNATLRMLILPTNGSGYIELSGKDNNNTVNNELFLNFHCSRNTRINTGANGGYVYLGSSSASSKVFVGDFINMNKHVEIGDPVTGINNAATNTALDINVNSGNGLRFKTTSATIPLIKIEKSTTPVFNVYGDGLTEINTGNLDALVVKDANLFNNTVFKVHSYGTSEITTTATDALIISNVSGSPSNFKVRSNGSTEITSSAVDALIVKNGNAGSTNFNIKSDGKTFIGNSVGIGTLPSTTTFLNVNAGSNTSNADLLAVGSSNTPNAIKMDSKGVTVMNLIATTGSVFKIKNQGVDLFAVGHNGVSYTRELIVTLAAFPDYVFSNDYNLPKLKEVKNYVKENSRLPHMPSAEEIKRNGAPVGEIQRLTIEKVEELYLYVFQLEEKIEALTNQLKSIEKK